MNLVEIIFWMSVVFLFYTYFGYPFLMVALSKIPFVKYLIKMPEGFGRVLLNPKIGGYAAYNDVSVEKGFSPRVSMIIAAYNEEDFLKDKIKNCLELDYPRDKIEFIFVTDGSTDNSNKILEKYKSENLFYYFLPKRSGKLHAIKRVIEFATGIIIIFSDANAVYNKDSIRKIVRHFAHSKVGCVAGEKRVLKFDGSLPSEGLYWRYESFIKKLDSELYSVVGAAGEIFAIRKNLFPDIPEDSIIEDFVLSLEIARKGFRVLYESEAYSMETPPRSFVDEFKRRLRMSRGGIQSIGFFKNLLQFREKKFLSFQFVSHRLLRWGVAPICLIIAFITNFILKETEGSLIYINIFYAQLLFYGAAVTGLLTNIMKVKIFGINLIFTFTLMN
ncbi:MAG: glycosyltransferase family 2 protein, partial [Bacteroidetes bacterium]|nr:glycosyltransferase family 2 protein [Bacteroidota bacterium]